MAISANSLLHFTRTKTNLVSILENGFYPRYCLEDFSETGVDFRHESKDKKFAIPMVCFCDIPLSKIEEHTKFYGEYGIGLKKAWGKQNKLNPLLYVTKNSSLSKHLAITRTALGKPTNGKDAHTNWTDVASYIKPVVGNIYKNGRKKNSKKYFYDENEWRHVPTPKSGNFEPWLPQKNLSNEKTRKLDNNNLKRHTGLKFKYSDVKYLIVPSPSDAKRLAEKLINLANKEILEKEKMKFTAL